MNNADCKLSIKYDTICCGINELNRNKIMSAITPFDDLFNQSIFLNQNLLLAGKHSHFFYLPVHLEVEVLWPTVLATWEAGYEGDSQLDLAVLVELNQGRRQIEGAAEVGHYEEVLLPLKQNVHFNTHHRTIWKIQIEIQIEICQPFCIMNTACAAHYVYFNLQNTQIQYNYNCT